MKLIYPFTPTKHTPRWPIIFQRDVTQYMPKTDFCVIYWYILRIIRLITFCIM